MKNKMTFIEKLKNALGIYASDLQIITDKNCIITKGDWVIDFN